MEKLSGTILNAELLCLVPAGGLGSRLGPLTTDRAKPSVAISFDEDGQITRMIDIPLTAIHEAGGTALVSTLYAPESLNFVNDYDYAQTIQEDTPGSPVDTFIDNLPLISASNAKVMGIVPGDAWIESPLLNAMKAALTNHQADAAILATRDLPGHNVHPIDKNGMVVPPGQEAEEIADLGVHLFTKEWLLDRLRLLAHKKLARGTSIWEDLYDINQPTAAIHMYVPDDAPTWVDMGTSNTFYETVYKINQARSDRYSNIAFPGAVVHDRSAQIIALPQSTSSRCSLKRAIIPEGKTVCVAEEALAS